MLISIQKMIASPGSAGNRSGTPFFQFQA